MFCVTSLQYQRHLNIFIRGPELNLWRLQAERQGEIAPTLSCPGVYFSFLVTFIVIYFVFIFRSWGFSMIELRYQPGKVQCYTRTVEMCS
jgi:hypothetical protein